MCVGLTILRNKMVEPASAVLAQMLMNPLGHRLDPGLPDCRSGSQMEPISWANGLEIKTR